MNAKLTANRTYLLVLVFMLMTSACADQVQFHVLSSADSAPNSGQGSNLPTNIPASPNANAPGTASPNSATAADQAPTAAETLETPKIEFPNQVDEVPETLVVKNEEPIIQLPELGTAEKPLSPIIKVLQKNKGSGAISLGKPVPEFAGMPYKLAWEDSTIIPWNVLHRDWSNFVFKLIKNEVAHQLMGGADDIEKFCPKYRTLDNDLRVNFWGALVSAIVKFESDYNPTTSVTEGTMGTDPVTHAQVRSEGLMQLSYQDVTGWSFCNFDWEKDKNLSTRDPKKTILNPYRNLSCGVRILSQQVQLKHRIAMESDVYWAVLKVGGKYQKIDAIAAMTRKMIPPCN